MLGRIVEIAEDGRHLAVERGFMVVTSEGRELGRVPLDDIGVVLANAHGLTYSNNLLVQLAARGAPLVVCAANHRPVAWLWPIEGNHIQAARMRAQIDAARPLCKRLWRKVIRAKVAQQGAVLEALGRPSGGFQLLAAQVRSGDPENIEAQAARRYWPLLLGDDFRRDPDAGGANALLNYGYAVLRATTARAIAAAGLHPSIGIHHRNRYNPLCLADDLMEPFRPFIDLAVARLLAAGSEAVTPETKLTLAGVIAIDLRTQEGTTPLSTCVQRLATSLAQAFETGDTALDLPFAPLPLELADGSVGGVRDREDGSA